MRHPVLSFGLLFLATVSCGCFPCSYPCYSPCSPCTPCGPCGAGAAPMGCSGGCGQVMNSRPSCWERHQMKHMARWQRFNEVSPGGPFGTPCGTCGGYYPGGGGFSSGCGPAGCDQTAMFGPPMMDDGMMMPGPMGMNGMNPTCPTCQQQFGGPMMSQPMGTPIPSAPPAEPTPVTKPMGSVDPASAMYFEMPQSMPSPSAAMPMNNVMYAPPVGAF